MRTVLAILLFSTSALAAPPGLTPPQTAPKPAFVAIDPDTVPEKCLDLALRAGSPETTLAETSRVSLALCIANEKERPIVACDCQQSIQDFDEATAPAFAILDDLAAAATDPSWQVIALHTEADILDVAVRKLERALPALPPDAGSDQRELRDVRAAMLRPLLEPWRTRAQNALAQVDRIAKAHPEVGKNQVADAAVRDSRRRLAPAVSSSR